MSVNFKLLRTDTADKRPTAAQLSIGELALCYEGGDPGLFFEDSAGAVRKVGPISVGTTAPNSSAAGSTGNSIGEGWLDTSVTPKMFKFWNGTAWVSSGGAVSSVNTQTGAVVLDADDISDSATTNKFATQAELNSIASATQPGDNVSTLTNDAGYITATGTYWTEGTSQLYPDATNSVLIGGTLPASPNITLSANGSATFAGTVTATAFDGTINDGTY